MKTILAVCALVACALGATIERRNVVEKRDACTGDYARYKDVFGVHTMCDNNEVASGSVSEENIQTIVNLHNQLRANETTAKQMCKMYWDPILAKTAAHLAKSCPKAHDKGRVEPGYHTKTPLGQNLAWGSATWADAITHWHAEIKDWKYGVGSINGNAVGHYTQVVKDTACRVGCGYALCPGTGGQKGGRTYVCNYMSGQLGYKEPFIQGTPCEGCKECSDDTLCDCKGKMCYRGGTLKMSDCTCECKKPFKGEFCNILDCASAPDIYACGTQFNTSTCELFNNVPEMCPRMCKLCTEDNEPGEKFFDSPATTLVAGDGSTGTGSTGTGDDTGAGSTVTEENTGTGTDNTGTGSDNTGTGSTGTGDNTGTASNTGSDGSNAECLSKNEDPAYICANAGYTTAVNCDSMKFTSGGTSKMIRDWCPETCTCLKEHATSVANNCRSQKLDSTSFCINEGYVDALKCERSTLSSGGTSKLIKDWCPKTCACIAVGL